VLPKKQQQNLESHIEQRESKPTFVVWILTQVENQNMTYLLFFFWSNLDLQPRCQDGTLSPCSLPHVPNANFFIIPKE
jgi:hypothetical protein